MSLENLKAAVEALEEALEVLGPTTHPLEWVQVQGDLARALYAWGIHAREVEAWRRLNEAVEAYRRALDICSREKTPEEWATLQADLGAALLGLGERTAGASGIEFIEASAAAFSAAQEVNVPRGKSWTTWRAVQDQLVIALIALTERCTGEQRARHAQHLASAMSEGMRSAVAQRREAREPKLPEKKRRPPRAG